MKFVFKPAPNNRQKKSTQKIMLELTLGLLVVYAFALYKSFALGSAYGINAILLLVTSVAVAIITEVIYALITKQEPLGFLRTSFPWGTAIILTLMVPVNTSLYAIGVSTFVAIFFAKLVFGGFGQNIFNPAAIGRATIFASFTGAISADLVTGATPTASMASAGWTMSNETFNGFVENFGGMSNMFVGNYAGSLGETSALIILLVGLVLAIRNVIDWRVPVSYLLALFLGAWVIALVQGMGIWYPLFHVLTGGAIFGAVFMMTDPVTNPTTATGRTIFAIGCAIITLLIRVLANLPEGVLYSILLMNMLTPAIDKALDGQQIKRMKKNAIILASISIIGLVCIFGAATTLVAKEVTVNDDTQGTNLNLGSTINISDDFSRFDAQVEVASDGVYNVRSKGYGLIDPEGHASESETTYARNEFEIKITNGAVESVVFKTFGDTEGIGDQCTNQEYLDLYKDLTLDSSVDTITNATWTSKSIAASVQAALNAANE